MNYFDKPKILMTIIVLLIVLNIVTISFMWLNRPPDGPGRDGLRPANFLIEKVGFSSEQIQTYHQLMQEHQSSSRSINDSLRFYKKLIFNNLSTNSSTEITSAVKAVGRLQQKIELTTFDHFVKVRALCTPEQTTKFDAVIDEVLRMMAPAGPPRP